jgi:LuxR family maltose regulon positive regulatory protein
VLVRSWIGQAGLAERVAWVQVGLGERDPQKFWLSVVGALRETLPCAALMRPLTAAPELDGWVLVERILTDLAPLSEPVWLVIDDVHEFGFQEVRQQLELLVMRANPRLRFVFTARHDVPLGLHRLRLEGGLAEIREPDLRFTLDEATELLEAAGVSLPDPGPLVRRTEGWAAGLRLAALSLVGRPDAERFAAEFSGSERTVADYLLAEVLDRQDESVRRLLLRTSLLERVNGELADLLSGGEAGARALWDLEAANAFVVPLDMAHSWFRYHQLFADLLQLELRRTAPGEVAELHRAAAVWFAEHAYPAEAVRHAQAALDWPLAARLLADHWPGLYLEGNHATIHELLADFPVRVRAQDAELAALVAADELSHGSLQVAERYLALAEKGSASLPEARRARGELQRAIVRLLLARQRGDLAAEAEAAPRLQALAGAPDAARPALGQDLRALALTGLGSSEYWTAQFAEAREVLAEGIALARRIERPYLEFTGLAHLAAVESFGSYTRAAEYAQEAIRLAERHGWTNEHAAGVASVVLGGVLAWRGRLEEAEHWVQLAERAVRAEVQPIAGIGVYLNRAVLELGRGRNAEALAAFRAMEALAGLLAEPSRVLMVMRAFQLQTLVLCDIELAEKMLAEFDTRDRELGEVRTAIALLLLTQDDPRAASAELAPVLDGSAQLIWPAWLAQAYLLEAIAREALGEERAADRALEQALEQAEPDGALLCFLLHPVPAQLERLARHGTAHAALIADILTLISGEKPLSPIGPQPLLEPLSDSEIRVLRYLPTNLPAPDIAAQLSLSPNTVKTHTRHLYAKLGTHTRSETVERARALGLLAPSAYRVAQPKA